MQVAMTRELSDIAGRIAASRRVTAGDVLEMRRALYSKAEITRAEAERLLTLEHELDERDPAWNELYVEALCDYFFQGKGEGSLSEADATFLHDRIMANGAVGDACELRLLLKLTKRAHACPESLVALACDALRYGIEHSSEAIFGVGERRPGVVDAEDVTAIRKLVFGVGGDGGMNISRAEAEWLIAIDHATRDADNHRDWADLMVGALTMHLLHGGKSPDQLDASEAAWLDGQLDRGSGLTRNGAALKARLRAETSKLPPPLVDAP